MDHFQSDWVVGKQAASIITAVRHITMVERFPPLELRDYMRILRRNWILIVSSTLLGVLAASLFTLLLAPKYTATTRLFVATQSSGSVQELQQGNTFTQARVKSYVETVSTPAVLQPAIDSLGLEVSAAQLAQSVDASADLNTVIITISASSDSPAQSAAIAQAVGESLVKTVELLESPSAGGISPVKLSVVTPAVAPASPSSPDAPLNVTIGFLIGLAAGVVLALLRASMDTRVRGEEDLRRVTDLPILGAIAFDSVAAQKPLISDSAPQSTRAESFRQIRTNLQFTHVDETSQTLMVTSSIPAEGKTTTAINLAIALADSGQSVVLVDADLRRPRVDEYLGLERNAGLTTALSGQAEVDDLLQPWGEHGLFVLTSGRVPPNPSELLGSQAMKSIIDHLESSYDVVIIDAPPLLPVTDAAVLGQQVGGVILVTGSNVVTTKDLGKSIAALGMVEANVIGVVMNKLPTRGPDAYSYSYYSYASDKYDLDMSPSKEDVADLRPRRSSTTAMKRHPESGHAPTHVV